MDLLKGLFIAVAAVQEAEMPEEEIRSAISYIMKSRDYVQRVKKSNLLQFTFLPPYNARWQPRPTTRIYHPPWRSSPYGKKGRPKRPPSTNQAGPPRMKA